jgi:hypothetical protein
VYDFFQSNMKFFQQGALFRLFKHLELRMADQLRQVLGRSLQGWVSLIKRSCEARPSLFDVALVVKKGQVVLEPSAGEIEAALLLVLQDVATGVQGVQAIDAAIMALLHLPVGLPCTCHVACWLAVAVLLAVRQVLYGRAHAPLCYPLLGADHLQGRGGQ